MKPEQPDYPLRVDNSPELRGASVRGAAVISPGVAGFSARALCRAALVACAAASPVIPAPPAQAQITQEGGDFTFRRVAPPNANAKKRITVQIDPEAEVFRITPGEEPRRPGDPRPEAALITPDSLLPDAPQEFDWYWALVPPGLGVDPARRFNDALAAIEQAGPNVPTPRLQTLREIADRHGVDILTSTIGTNVSPALVLAVIAIESAGRRDAVSHAGAEGLMQLIPATAKRFGVADSMVPRDNIRGGVAYLDWLFDRFNGDPVLALAGYNAGEGAVDEHAGVPPYKETRAYVPKVLSAWNVARGLCLTRPELISDGCVFVTASATSSSR